jgi:hypothetical protein
VNGSTFQLTPGAGTGVRKSIAWSCVAILFVGIGMLAAATRADAAVSVWTPRTMAVPVGGSEIKGAGVSCPQSVPNFCMGVGSYKASTKRWYLAERWNGEKWEVQTLPAGEVEENSLNAISCPTSTYCMAVGQSKNGGKMRALTAQWDGTTWLVKGLFLPPETDESVLNGVSCFSSTNCVAVGYSKKAGPDRALERRPHLGLYGPPQPRKNRRSGTERRRLPLRDRV